jgi:hypothetical protein
MIPTNPIDDDDQASLVIQREIGMALRMSFETATTRDPLPEQMALLLLRLALAESLGATVEEDRKKGKRSNGVVRRWLSTFSPKLSSPKRSWRFI